MTTELTHQLKQAARELGFTLVGVAPASGSAGYPRLVEWLARGYAGTMAYLAERLDAYRHPSSVLPEVRSLLLLALPYRSVEPRPASPGAGRVSRYAWSDADYHDVIHFRLKQLVARLRELAPHARARGVVDTAPLPEREFAQLAGLGWIGKHTLLLNRQAGSWFFLAALLTDLELAADEPFTADHCGTCRACLDACPTQAFPAPHVLDASRCISYLTIEHRGPIPVALRESLGSWVFGCDVCQDVCPWNRKSPASDEPSRWAPRADLDPLDLAPLFELTDDDFRRRFRTTPLWRTKRRGLLRNAALALGNQHDPAALPALERGLHDPEPLVRGASAWALRRLDTPAALDLLAQRLAMETDEQVRAEILGQEPPFVNRSIAETPEEA